MSSWSQNLLSVGYYLKEDMIMQSKLLIPLENIYTYAYILETDNKVY